MTEKWRCLLKAVCANWVKFTSILSLHISAHPLILEKKTAIDLKKISEDLFF